MFQFFLPISGKILFTENDVTDNHFTNPVHNRPNRGSRAGAYAPPTKINQSRSTQKSFHRKIFSE
jgi:hypothetical protein